ncbi:S-layer homology domain-containing protein [Brevibacillus ruminantium]|uniref:S-layer homology domain-containing protein n=1 Tax=Brevibacillus ruminantium TaxID=2950604 RepID=A0ABY4WJ91_9BACL|nr:YcdB/YcdC domain-containing protein [Brevibacillus ruminantium]USG67200.1 S-layer homology domain-containing protein [Brevibacillus ruminantium]
MKKLLIRSGSIVLTASLLAPGALAYGDAMAASFPAASSSADSSTSSSPSTPASSARPAGNSSSPAVGKVKLSKEAALKIASSFVSTDNLELSNVSFRSADDWRAFPEWTFFWVSRGKNQKEIERSYTVGIHADTGELTAFSSYDQKASSPDYANRISYQDAQAKAEQFFAANVPGKRKQTRLYTQDMPVQKTPLNADASYTFHFVRLVDDIPFPDNGVEITINPSGAVSNFSVSWNDSVIFDKEQKGLTLEEAEQRFREEVKPDMAYTLPWESMGDNREKPLLVYANPFSFYLDGKDGSVLTPSLKPQKKLAEPVPVSKTSLAPRHRGGALSQDEAVSAVQKMFDLSGYTLRSANYSDKDYRGGKAVWYLDFENGAKKQNTSVAVDALNGDIYNYNSYRIDPSEKETVKAIDRKAFQKRAVEDLKKYAPTLADKLYLLDSAQEEDEQTGKEVTVSFIRLENGVRAATGSAHLTYNTVSNELLSFNVDIGRESYPSQLPAHLSAEKATEAWLKEAKPEAVYMLERLPARPLERESQGEIAVMPLTKREAKLVYRMSITPYEAPYVLDAVTGEWRSQANGKTVELHRTPPADLEGHKAEKELLLMYEYDALSLTDGKIMPNKEITRGEMIEMLMLSLNQGRLYPVAGERKASFADVANTSRFFAAVEAAVDRGLLDRNAASLKPDEKITREELADMLVRALGYRKLAEYSEMFQSDLTDISGAKHRGAIIIVNGLGIMPANKEFQPDESVTRADAAVAFVRFLEKRSQLEAPPSLQF